MSGIFDTVEIIDVPSVPQPTYTKAGDKTEKAANRKSKAETDEEIPTGAEEVAEEDWEDTNAIVMDASF